jgi:hypothetical protein
MKLSPTFPRASDDAREGVSTIHALNVAIAQQEINPLTTRPAALSGGKYRFSIMLLNES